MRYDTNLLKKRLRESYITPYFLESVDSTNDYARALLNGGREGEFVIISEEQTAGKGRFNRKWVSQQGKGIWMSLVKNNIFGEQNFGLISLVASLSVFDSIYRLFNLKTEIKWPNDILYGGKKLCGILIEGFKKGEKISKFIIGIGVNIYHDQDDFPEYLKDSAVSLISILNKNPVREKIVLSIVKEINSYFDLLKEDKEDFIISRWKEHSININKNVAVDTGKEIIKGKAVDINVEGSLMIKTKDRKLIAVNSGQIVEMS
ncbi:biotin--[acetyl-CoA-carboxylase] ligase [candidate division KSB1 bacterium]